MASFLLELLTEEIPARMQSKAADDLGRLFAAALTVRGLNAEVETHVTPRRLALFARNLPLETEATTEERRGPRADATAQAIEGFLRSTGLPRAALEERLDPKGRFLYAVIATPGRATRDVLPAAVTEAVAALPWPKSMRWGEASTSMDSPRWVRPLTSVLALLDSEIVPLEVLGIASGRETRGHRFMGRREPLTIESAATYDAQLRAAHVILSAAERRRIIAEGARAAAAAAGLALIEDEGLVAENAGLTEWPVPLLGHFDPAFLRVPREVIQLTMRVNQKYFALSQPILPAADRQGAPQAAEPILPAKGGEGDQPQAGGGAAGRLAPAFICVANLIPADGGATIIEGNRRVLAARLSDARFFWEQDLREWREAAARGPDGLGEHFAPKLERITFHEKLGSMRDKAERVARLARWLVESGAVKPTPTPVVPGSTRDPSPPPSAESPTPATVIPGLTRDPASSSDAAAESPLPDQVRDDALAHLAALAERAGRLAKADLVTSAVGEFPELQGLMGGYYALASGEDPEVATAIRDHYKPVGPSDAVPADPVTVAVALADKLDSLAAFFGIGEAPTGSRDPFALRRSALGVIRILTDNAVRLPLGTVEGFGPDLLAFFADRLKVQSREAGVRHDLIDAVFALGQEDDLVRLLARVQALQSFIATEDGVNLLAAYRRAANILAIETKKDAASGANGISVPPGGISNASECHSGAPNRAQATQATQLAFALDQALPAATAAIENEDFEAAMAVLAGLRAPIDSFFEHVLVNDPSPEIRRFHLGLLARFTKTAHAVADFSKIEG